MHKEADVDDVRVYMVGRWLDGEPSLPLSRLVVQLP